PMGDVDRVCDDSGRRAGWLLHARDSPGAGRRGLADRGGAPPPISGWRRLDRPAAGAPHPLRPRRASARLVRHGLRVPGGNTAGVAVARAARLSVDVSKTWDGGVAR